ncbi:MAG: SDR family NAD(P)-dependent oxidoreductase [Verrucomicrobiae bacterium]|nr:SDR family NAD(P)-dependent oxidoreductase [Verrucomicrobiae bacterium]
MNPHPSQVVLVTGAGGGLGQALVNTFAQRGWTVAAAGHSALPCAPADTVWPCRLDVTQSPSCRQLVAAILARWGRLDALINNAGLSLDAILPRLDPADWDRVLDVNLKGAFLCSQAALPSMLENKSGHILNIASFAARSGAPGQAHYAAAKAGLIGLTLSLAREVGPLGVCVNAILPGVLDTPMTRSLPVSRLEAFRQQSVFGQLASVGDAAVAVEHLARLRHVSGQIIPLDGRIAPWT